MIGKRRARISNSVKNYYHDDHHPYNRYEVTNKTSFLVVMFLVLAVIVGIARSADLPPNAERPNFTEPISNVTIPVGREATLACVVKSLGSYKVAWLRVNTQTILTLAHHVITKNHRIYVTHSDKRTWFLHIKDVQVSDAGDYMCQINTDPMINQVGWLNVVVPPDILDDPTSTDMVVREGSNVTLKCAASGSPSPSIAWRRETGDLIALPNGTQVTTVEGSELDITKISRQQMGAYLCIASNGVPPAISKRISVTVHFPPMIQIQNQLVGSQVGQEIILNCTSEAYPKSINYWTRGNDKTIENGDKYETTVSDMVYKVHMVLTIRSVKDTDYGEYKCVSNNSLGSTDGTIKLYHIPTPTTTTTTTTTTEAPTTTTTTTMRPIPTVSKARKKQKVTGNSDSRNENTVGSKSTTNNKESRRGKGHDDGGNGKSGSGRKNSNNGHRNNDLERSNMQTDKTAQPRSSTSAAAANSMPCLRPTRITIVAAICLLILLSHEFS